MNYCPKCKTNITKDTKNCKICGSQLDSSTTRSIKTEPMFVTQQISSSSESVFANRYQILSTIGQGGMGEVFKVIDLKLQEKIALKILKPELAENPVFIQRFRNELKLARKITHKNVCRVFDFREEERTPFITMEYVEGENLKTLIKREGCLNESKSLEIAIQIAEGLSEAHELGVIHRDLKPHNIQIDLNGHAKIMDFGIACSIEASGLTETGMIVGTPDYLSAEQASGQPTDFRSDIYAFGVLFYEMATGELPFKEQSVNKVLLLHKTKKPADPRTINPVISEGLSKIILRCLEKKREQRYQTVEELLVDLHNIFDKKNQVITSKVKRINIFGIRNPVFAFIIFFLMLIAVSFFFLINPKSDSIDLLDAERPSVAVLYFENNTGNKKLAHWQKAFAELLISDLSQSKYIKVLQGDRIYRILRDLDQLEAVVYASDILEKIAQKGRVRYIIRGNYIKAGTSYRVSISIQDMKRKELVGTHTAIAENEEKLFGLVDNLTKKIKSKMNLTTDQIAGDFDKDAAEVITSSPTAYKYFIQGLRYIYQGKFEMCIEFMDKALKIDPDFVSAIYWSAFAYENNGNHKAFIHYMNWAFKLRDRISKREKFRFTAMYYLKVKNDIPRATEEYEKFVRFYPDDKYANHQLGLLYRNVFEDYEKSIKFFLYNIKNRVLMFHTYYAMAWTEMCLGNYDKAEDICRLFISDIRDHPAIRFKLSINYLCQGEYGRAIEEAEKSEKLGYSKPMINLLKGCILQIKGDLRRSETYFRKVLGTKNHFIRIWGKEFLGLLALLEGRYDLAKSIFLEAIKQLKTSDDKTEMSMLYLNLAYIGFQTEDYDVAINACNDAIKFRRESSKPLKVNIFALQLKGICLLELNKIDDANQIVVEINNLSEKSFAKSRKKEYFHLIGNIQLKKGNLRNAVINFEKAVKLLPAQNQNDFNSMSFHRTLYIYDLAKAYYMAGAIEKAKKFFISLSSLTIGRIYWGDRYVKAFYWLGKINEKQGKKKEAISHYKTFLKYWENTEFKIPEMKDARKRLKME